MADKKIDVIYVSGWLHGRLASTDEASGESNIVPGLHFRIRIDRIIVYSAGEPGVLIIWIEGMAEPADIIGSIAAIDKVMKMHTIREVSR